MPIYEYKCQACGKTTEIFQRTAVSPAITCSHCGSGNMEKLVSAPGAILKERSGRTNGTTCCGRQERCETPACSTGEGCRRDH